MKNKFWMRSFWAAVLAAAILLSTFLAGRRTSSREIVREIKPFRGAIETAITTTGTILPKNRLEIKPPVNGRIEQVLIKEGAQVKVADILAWMSSTERAALLDSARGQGEETLRYWEDAYKPIPLLAPIDGEVIVATTQPGQSVMTNDAVFVLSDHLIVRAQVDETDIGKISLGQKATVTLDAYPETKIQARVEHIYYESKAVNNVTIYEVDLVPEEVPPSFRSGMNASCDFIEERREGVLLVPSEAVQKDKAESFVWVSQGLSGEPVRRPVTPGISDDKNTQVISGVNENDTLILKTKKYSLPKDAGGTNPFMPNRRRS